MPLMIRRLFACLCLVLACLSPSMAEQAPDLYQAHAVTSGTMPARRALGFAICMREVLVKVSGDPRLAEDPRTGTFAERAADYVTGFEFRDRLTGVAMHDEQGSYDRPHDLTCVFDESKIDAVLAMLGSKPWPQPRPSIVVSLEVRDMKGRTWSLTDSMDGQTEQDMRLSLLGSAPRFGLNVRLATAAETAKGAQSAAPGGAGEDVLLSGSLIWSDEALGWVANWSIRQGTEQASWQVRGVGFDDAFRNGLGGAAQVLSGNGRP